MALEKNNIMLIAALLNFAAAVLHIGAIVGGAPWYRFLGAGEEMAQMAQQGSYYPATVTTFIVCVLLVWAAYAASGGGYLRCLPLLKAILVVITATYCVRGVAGLFVPIVSNEAYVQNLGVGFWLWSSAISLAIGIVHAVGLMQIWGRRRKPICL